MDLELLKFNLTEENFPVLEHLAMETHRGVEVTLKLLYYFRKEVPIG
jgi:hypothetical protein